MRRCFCIGLMVFGLTGGFALSASAADQSKKTIGLAVYAWEPALYQGADSKKEECPNGFHATNMDNWLVEHPTEQSREEYARKFIYLGPEGGGGPHVFRYNRGPQGQNSSYNPTLVKDTYPLREASGKFAYGFNLDGTADGNPTPMSCKHGKFESPEDGTAGIDNQLFRLMGCSPPWRKGGGTVGLTSNFIRDRPENRVLIEVSGVDDEMNDDHVDIGFYKGVDGFNADPSGKPIPGFQQTIDPRFPKFTSKTTGRIVDGVLYSDPVDHRIPAWLITAQGQRYLRGMRVRFKLDASGAEGLIGGYENLREFWLSWRNSYSHVNDEGILWSPPAFYEALNRLADGYPDPKTGECTAISAAYKVRLIRVTIVEPAKDDPLVVDSDLQAARRTVTAAHAVDKREVDNALASK